MTLQPHRRRLVLGGLALLVLLVIAGGIALTFYRSNTSSTVPVAPSQPASKPAQVTATAPGSLIIASEPPVAMVDEPAFPVAPILVPLPPTAPTLVMVPLTIPILAAVVIVDSSSVEDRFARSRPELEAFATRVMAAKPSTPILLPHQLGKFMASDGMRLPHGFLFRADYGHPLDWNGFAYSTVPLPKAMPDPQPSFEKMYFEPLGGNWYKVWRN